MVSFGSGLLDSSVDSHQEAEHLAINDRGQGHPQASPRETSREEDRPPLPPRIGGSGPEHEGRNDQGCDGRNSQAVQEESKWIMICFYEDPI